MDRMGGHLDREMTLAKQVLPGPCLKMGNVFESGVPETSVFLGVHHRATQKRSCLLWDLSWFCGRLGTCVTPETKADSLLRLLKPPSPRRSLILVPLFSRICFPVQVNRLPRETLLCATLYALPIPPPGSSSEANKQRRVPEALGWVTTPLFNFRQYVSPRGPAFGLGREQGDEDKSRVATLSAPWEGLATWRTL